MRRRDFLYGLLCAASTGRIAVAQNAAGALRKIGVVTLGVPQSAPIFLAFITGLHELGYDPGKTLFLNFAMLKDEPIGYLLLLLNFSQRRSMCSLSKA